MMNLTTAPRTLRPTGAACTVGSPVVSVQPRRGQVAAGASVLAPLRPPIPSLISSRPPTAPASGSEPPCSGRAVSTSGRALSFLLRCFSTFALAFRATVPLSVPARSSLPSSPVSCLAASVPSLPSVFGLRLPVCHPSQSPGLSQPTALPLSCPASCLGKTDSRLLEYHSLTPQMPSLSSLPLPCGWVLSAPARLPFPGLGCGEVGERIRKKPRPLLERNILISPRLGALLESCLK